MKKIVILGAGISGLALAWFLKKRFKDHVDLTLLEKRERVGGWIQTIQENGFLFESGPRGFRPSGKGLHTLELALELGLEKELIPANKQARKRYIFKNGKLNAISIFYLLRQGLIPATLRDLRTPKNGEEDETIESFITRRFNARLSENLFDPVVKGIFGGDVKELSIRSCFPLLWKFEQEQGSVIRGFWKSRKKKKTPPPTSLYSFQKGMETLPRALAKQLEARILLNKTVKSIDTLEADYVISALPAYALAELLHLDNPVEYKTLSTVSFGWNESILKKRGFGFLVPSKERGEILGMTWDSEIFPQQNHAEQTRICVMIEGEYSEDELYERALHSLGFYLGKQNLPSAYAIRIARRAIPQYTLNYHKRIETFKKALPPNFSVVGNSYEGVGINDCISQTKFFAENISFSS